MALRGIQVLELAGLAPVPFCGMVLSDFGANVIRIDKVTSSGFGQEDFVSHGKKSVALNFKMAEGVEAFKKLSTKSDVVIDPFRPGVMEKLKLGPSDLMSENKRLIYARITGYGQDGPLAKTAGHDLNYLGISGALSFLGGRSEPPCPPVNLLADFAGGGLSTAMGIILALYERQNSGLGQVVDCSMTRGAAYVSSWLFRGLDSFLFCNPRGENVLDGGSFFYNTYKTKDGKWMAVGSLEPKFYENLLKGLNISDEELPQSSDPDLGRQRLSKEFSRHTQDHWIKIFSTLDACVTPVLSPVEAAAHQHNRHQETFKTFPGGTLAPTAEPRLSRTPALDNSHSRPPYLGQHTADVLKSVGYTEANLKTLLEKGAIGVATHPTSKL